MRRHTAGTASHKRSKRSASKAGPPWLLLSFLVVTAESAASAKFHALRLLSMVQDDYLQG